MTLRGLPLRRPLVVSRKAPHFPGRGGHSPLRPPLARTIRRCTCQAATTNHRGGRRPLPPARPTPLAEDLTITPPVTGHGRIRRRGLRRRRAVPAQISSSTDALIWRTTRWSVVGWSVRCRPLPASTGSRYDECGPSSIGASRSWSLGRPQLACRGEVGERMWSLSAPRSLPVSSSGGERESTPPPGRRRRRAGEIGWGGSAGALSGGGRESNPPTEGHSAHRF